MNKPVTANKKARNAPHNHFPQGKTGYVPSTTSHPVDLKHKNRDKKSDKNGKNKNKSR